MFSYIRIQDIADIIIMSFLLYQLYSWFKHTKALQVVIGLSSLGIIYFVTKYFGLFMTSWILQEIGTVLFVLIIVVFQSEIRQALYRFSLLRNLVGRQETPPQIDIQSVTNGVFSLAASRTGAIIVFQRKEPVDEYLLHGVMVDGLLSSHLIGTIFRDGTPLHDGAVVIKEGRVALASCHLPLSANSELPQYLGTRHRAGIGLTERSDAVVVVVSEERGEVSLAQAGELQVIRKPEELADTLRSLLTPAEPDVSTVTLKKRVLRNLIPKISIVLLVFIAWLIVTGRQGGIVSVTAPVKFHNLPDDLTLTKSTPEQVDLQLKVFSSLVSSPRLADIAVDLDLGKIHEGTNTVTVSENELKLPLGVMLTGVNPAQIRVSADKKIRKPLRVKVKSYGYLPEGFHLRRIKAEPFSILAEGPAAVLSQLDVVQTEDIDLAEIRHSTVLDVKLLPPPPQVRFLGDSSVHVRIVTARD